MWRAFRARHDLVTVVDRTADIGPKDVLAVLCIRNEAERLPHFLSHYRRLGVSHFLVVNNGSTDGGGFFLKDQPDVSMWRTEASYRLSRFGLDWVNWLLCRHGSGHWCLTVDADELLVYRNHETRDLQALVAELDLDRHCAFGALMLDLYPRSALGTQSFVAGEDPLRILTGFDPHGYRVQVQPRMGALWVQGGVRGRVFFGDTPERAPTLNKTPLVRWNWRYAYVNSTHSALPRRLNDWRGKENGVLLHTKFLPTIVARSREEKSRGMHFAKPQHFADYYDAIQARPVLWHEGSAQYEGWRSLDAAGLFWLTGGEGAIYTQSPSA